MKKYVAVAANEKSDYLFYLPLVCFTWNKIGWDVIYYVPFGNNPMVQFVIENIPDNNKLLFLPEVEGYESSTIAQFVRMYAANDYDGLIMLSDSDMLALSDYWKVVDSEHIAAYGRNLSNEHFPACYIQASSQKWKELMNLTGDTVRDLQRDLKSIPKIEWTSDQSFLTQKLEKRNDVVRIDRPINSETGYPAGRMDRSGSWAKHLEQKERIDAHLFRNGWEEENWTRIIELIKYTFLPTKEEVEWLNEYHRNFTELL